MGVQGLWQLLQPTGRPVTLESLEGKILAIDVSIWLHKSAKGVRGKDGAAVPNAHLLSLFHRLCKLYFYQIKPIFVFDGGVPVLKRQTLAARRQKADLADAKSKKSTEKILSNFIQSQALRKAAGKEPADISAILPRASTSEQDLFQLPPIPEESGYVSSEDEPDMSWEERLEQKEIIHSSFQDVHEIDVASDDFKTLPPEIRHEILTELKESRKQSLLSRAQELPQDSSEFSKFQMSRIIKKSKLTNEIEHARKDMNARSIEGVADTLPGSGEIESRRIMSRDGSHVIFVKGMKDKTGASTSITKKTHSTAKSPARSNAGMCTSSKIFELISVDSQPSFAADISTVKNIKSTEQRSPPKELPIEKPKGQGLDIEVPSVSLEGQGQDIEVPSASVEGQSQDSEKPSAPEDGQGQESEKPSAPEDGQGQESENPSAPEDSQGQESEKPSAPEDGQGQESEKPSAPEDGQGQESEKPSAPEDSQGQESEKPSGPVEGQGQDSEKPSASGQCQGSERSSASAEGQGQDSEKAGQGQDTEKPSASAKNNGQESGKLSAENQGQDSEQKSASAEVVELDDSGSDVEFIGQEGMSLRDVKYRKHIQIQTRSGNVINCQFVPNFTKRSPRGGRNNDAPIRIVTGEGGSVESESGESDVEVMDVTQKSPSEMLPSSRRQVLVPINPDMLRFVDGKYVFSPLESKRGTSQPSTVRTGSTTGMVDVTGSSSDSDIEVVSQTHTPMKSVRGQTLRPTSPVRTNNPPGSVQKRPGRSCLTLDSDDSDLEEIQNPRVQSDRSKNSVACHRTRTKSGTGGTCRPGLNTKRHDNERGAKPGKDGSMAKTVSESALPVVCNISDDEDSIASGEIENGEDSDSDEVVDTGDDSVKEGSLSVAVISDSSDEAETDEDDFIEVEPATHSHPFNKPSPSKCKKILPDSTVAMETDAVTMATGSGSLATKDVTMATVAISDDKEEETIHLGSQFENLTKDDVDDILESLATTKQILLKERAKQEMMVKTITEQMYSEAQGLLTLFGAPYVLSPMEAEAQCAYLDMTDQCDGSITEDSDTWLFGGKTVYKNFFNQDKHVECYRLEAIEQKLGLDRQKLINIALMCGCDYTEGIQGVGPVTAVEIMAEFPGEGYEGLKKFKEWWDEAQKQINIPSETKIKSKLRHLEIGPGFPSVAVVDAFLNPAVDTSVETFTWGRPDLDLLRDFATKKFGWTRTKTDELLLPVVKRMNMGTTQQTITKFFMPTYLETETRNVKSKRLKRALNRVAGAPVEGTSEPEKQTPDQTRLEKAVSKAKQVLERDSVEVKKGRKRKGKVTAATERVEDETEAANTAEGGNEAPKRKRVRKPRGKAVALESDSVAKGTGTNLNSESVPVEGGKVKKTRGGGKRKKPAAEQEESVVEGDGFSIEGADVNKPDDKDVGFAPGRLSEGHDTPEDEGPVLAPKRGRGGKRGARGRGRGKGRQDAVTESTVAFEDKDSLLGEVGKGKGVRGRGRGGQATRGKKTNAVELESEDKEALLGEVGRGKGAGGKGKGRGVPRGGRGKNTASLRHTANVSLIRDEVNLSDESLDEFGSDLNDDILSQALDAVEQAELQPEGPEPQTKEEAGFLKDKETSTYFTETKKAAKRPRLLGKKESEAEAAAENQAGETSAKGREGKVAGKKSAKSVRGGKAKAGRGRGAKK